MKIFLMVGSMNAGGAERVAATLVNAWAKRGHEVSLLVTWAGHVRSFYPLAPEVTCRHVVGRAGGRPRWLNFLLRLRALRRLVKTERPDVVVSFLSHVNVSALLATRGLGVPVIVSEHIHPSAETDAWRALGARWLYPRAAALVVLTERTARFWQGLLPRMRRIRVLPNPLPDLPAVATAPDPLPGRRRVMAMGRLVEQKQFDCLLRVFASLAASHPTWDVWIWGEGPMRAALEAQRAALGLENRVHLPGITTRAWDELQRADVFVLCSRYEGFPMVLFEAMALGRACVSFDCPSGPAELTDDGRDAVLVPAQDELALREALDALMRDEARRLALGARAAVSVRQRYGTDAVLAQWDALFDEVVPGRASSRPQKGDIHECF